MLRLTVYLALFVLAETDDLLGVYYTFDVDFYRNFNSKRCDGANMWQLVRYGALEIEPYADNDKAIQAIGESCASSFPIVFFGGNIEINVYSRGITKNFNFSVEVYGEDDTCITSFVNRRLGEDLDPGWQTISLEINKHVTGYIHIRGASHEDEVLLVDSFRYTPKDINVEDRRAKRSIDFEKEDEREIIFKYKEPDKQISPLESSGDDAYDTEPPPSPTTKPPEPENRSSIWNPFTISVVSFGVVVVVAMCVVGAYQYGKVRTISNDPLFVDEEPPRTVTIPRVTRRFNTNEPVRF